LEENTGDRFKPLEDRPEASTEFGRLGAVDVKVENARIAEAKARAVAEIKDRLIKEDIGGDSFTNAYNLFSKESSAERAARQERQARERANLEKYGTANPAPEFKDSLGGSFYNISEELRTNTPEGFGGKTIAEEYIKFSPNLPAGRQARAEGVLAAGRDAYGAEAPLISDLEKTKYDQGVASLANAEKGIAAGREAYGAEAPLAVDQEAKGLAALRDSVRMGDQPGAAADASRVAAGIGSAENKPTASVAGTPVTSGASTAGGAATAGGGTDANAGLGSFKEQGKAIDTGSMTLEGIRADRKREREDNLNLALIQAGLSIMGGKSSNALQNIGEGARAGVAQFASQESESKRLEREARRDLMEQQRSERDFREKQRQFGITSGLEDKRLTEAAESNRLTRELQAELGRGRLQLDTLTAKQNWESSQAKIELERTIANNTKAYQDGKLSLDQLTLKNQEAKDLADQNYKSELLKIEKQKLTQPSETVKTAATIGGWDPKSDKNPTAEQIIAGLDRMSEKDELSTLEKIIRDPLVQDEDLKKNATARFNAIMSRRGGISEGATATNSKGERIIYKGGQWVPYNP
jgi:hypothetical protein